LSLDDDNVQRQDTMMTTHINAQESATFNHQNYKCATRHAETIGVYDDDTRQ